MTPLEILLLLLCLLLGIGCFLQRRRRSSPASPGSEADRAGVLESVLEGLGDSCLLLNSQHNIAFANHETLDLFQVTGDLRGRPLSSLISDERILQFIRRLDASGAKWAEEEFRSPIVRGNLADERFLVVSAAPVQLSGDAPGRYLRVVIRDETDRHETEQIRKDFVANASHELRTPLSIINGYLENLLEGDIDDPAMSRKALITMQKHGERIARIVEDMLTLSKFESVGEKGIAGLRAASFSCRECAEDVVERLAPLVEEKRARFRLDFPPDGADEIKGDRFYWDQIFFNLIENALKENKPGNLEIAVTMAREDAASVIRIADNGIGIPRADLPFIFKRFYRVAKHHSQKIKGTGLGLSIVRRAVESHGGTISVDSTLGLETVFTIRLPDYLPDPDPDPPPPPAAPGTQSPNTSV